MANNIDQVFDVAIVGSGPAGLWAALELIEAGASVLIIEAVKRLHDTRNVSNGFMGGSAKSDVRLFLDHGFGGEIKEPQAFKSFLAHLRTHTSFSLKVRNDSLAPKQLQYFTQMGVIVDQPSTIVISSDKMAQIEKSIQKSIEEGAVFKSNCFLSDIKKLRGKFALVTSVGDFSAKKCILALGRGGAHWIRGAAKQLDLQYNDLQFDLGVRLEFPHQLIKTYTDKNSNFRLRWDNYRTTIPSVRGTVEMENVFDFKTSNGRSISGKSTHLSSIGLLKTFNAVDAFQKSSQLIQIANVLGDEQLLKEPINKILSKESILSPIKEYDSLRDGISKIVNLFPGLSNRCYLYIPEARLNTLKFDLSKNMETNIKGLYVAGDMSGRTNSFVQSACSGLIAAKHIAKS